MYSPDGMNVCGARGGEFEEIWCVRVSKIVKSCPYCALHIQLFSHF